MPRERHIVAMGGGGFSMEPENPLLDDFVLGLTGKTMPRVCFLPTASGDADGYIARFYEAFTSPRAQPSHVSLFARDDRDLRGFVLGQDVIYVGGGNVANLLVIWRLHGLDVILREAWERGIVLAGISAGMNCWFEACSTDSFGPLAPLRDGLGFLKGSACPHYDGEADRRPTFLRYIAEGALPDGYAADDGAALHFIETELAEVVASRASARAFRVHRDGEAAVETPLAVRVLTPPSPAPSS